MRITVCELPHRPDRVERAWQSLCEHTVKHRSELLLLPEFAFVDPVWESECFNLSCWMNVVMQSDAWLSRLPELDVPLVIGARPAVSAGGLHYNEGFLWSKLCGYRALRRKYFLPNESGGWEARWFARGDATFPAFSAGDLSFGLNICTELWALDTYAAYAAAGVNVIFSPRATARATTKKWVAIGTVAAVRSGAYCVSSNRAQADGTYGGVGWVISPDGDVLATTSNQSPFCTVAIDLSVSSGTARTYPRYVFHG